MSNPSNPVISGTDQDKLAFILAETKRRKQTRPLEFFKRLPLYERIRLDTANIIIIMGGNRSGKSEGVSETILDRVEKVTREQHRNMKIWVSGETFSDSVAIQQKKIWDLVPKDRVFYGKFDDINGFTNRKLQLQAWDNKDRGGTIFTFKSYDQGRDAFQSDDIDLIWNDEEPPMEIIKEQKMRLIDRNGKMIISMTSLKGVTELVADMYEDADVIESQTVPEYIAAIKPGLRGKVLPRIAEKNGVRFYFLWTIENPHVNQVRLLEELELMTDQEVLSRIFGIPENLAGKIYMSFNKKVHCVPLEMIPLTGNQLWNVLDPHDRKPWAIGWFLANRNGSLYMVDEYPNRPFNEMLYDDKTYKDYAAVIKAKEAGIREIFNVEGHVRRIIDPNFGNKTVQKSEREGGQSKTTPVKELAKFGLNYKDGIDALEAGHLAVRKMLHWKRKGGDGDDRNELVIYPAIYFGDWLINTILHLSRYSRKDTIAGDGDVKDKVGPQEKYKDFCDLVRYFIMAAPKWVEQKIFKVPTGKTY